MLLEGIRRFAAAMPEGIPGQPSPEGIKNMIDLELKIPLKIGDVARDRFLNFKLVGEVREELQRRK